MAKNKHRGGSSFLGTGITTTISISLVLLLFGLTILLGIMGRRISSFVKENISITVDIPSNARKNDITKLENKLKQTPYFKDITYITKEEAKQDLIFDLGKDPEESLNYNPLSDCLEIRLNAKYVNTDSIKVIEAVLKSYGITEKIDYSQEDIDLVNTNLSKIGVGLLGLAIVLMIISFSLIRNTIRLNIYAKRFLIKTMQLVGATNSFIRKPFIKQMLGYALVASIMANLIITFIVYYVANEWSDFISILHLEDLAIIYGLVFVIGLLITLTATYIAVNRYLKIKRDNLYYI